MRRSYLSLTLLTLALFLLHGSDCVAEDQREEIREWVSQLSDESFARRNEATRSLIAAGRPAIVPVSKVLGSADNEVERRASQVLSRFLASDDDQTYEETLEILRELSQSTEFDTR